MLPNFLLIGAMKCGTTSLTTQLAAHPQIFMPPAKELDFFSREENWNRGLPWYESFFREQKTETAIGEASASYTMHPMYSDVPARIAKILPNARFVYIVRHPIKRVISNYMHRWYEDQMDDDLESMLASNPQLLTCSRYYHQIEQYLRFFPADRFLVLVFEEFVDDPLPVLKEAFRFLGVSEFFVPKDSDPKNVTSQKVIEARWMRTARRLPLVKPIAKALLPSAMVRRITQIRGTRRPRVQMAPALYDKLVKVLQPEIEGLSAFARRDFGEIWDLKVQ